jgi:hypothetical protein
MKRKRCPACGRLEKRSTQANARYWMLMHMIADNVKPEGKSYSVEAWHSYWKSKLLGCDEFTMPNGKTMVIPKSSADLEPGEFADYQTQVEAWAAERGVYLADLAA